MASSCCWSMSTVHSALPTIKAPPSLSLVGYKPKKQCKGLFMLSHNDINPSGSNRVSAKTSTMPSFSNLLPFNTLLSTSGLFSGVDMGCKWFMMRHGRKVPKLNRPADQRKALLRGLTTQLLRHGRIKTTRARAKAMRKWVDKMITLAKNGTLHHRRQALAYIYDKQLVHAMFEEVGERYGERNGGYTRITRTWSRRGDNAPMAYIELV